MTYDLVIKNGMVIDGTGFARYRADLGIKDGTIATIGQLGPAGAFEQKHTVLNNALLHNRLSGGE